MTDTKIDTWTRGALPRLELWLALGVLAIGGVLGSSRTAVAQDADAQVLTAEELDELVGRIALYPDDLVGIVLPAATYPLQIVQAARFLDERANDSNLQPEEDWDDSVVALLNYPEVVRLLNEDLDWTWQLGEAVINQRADVLDAIQDFRDRAYAAGNLRSDERQVVSNDDGVIAIAPADPEVIYVPYYEPRRVVLYQSAPVYHYYPWAYPVYYYPYPAGYAFHSGFFWGVTSAFSVGWHTHFLHVHHHHYHGHPYYGHYYYDPFYVRSGINVNVSVSRGGYVWEPRYRHAGQPFAYSNGRRVAGTLPRAARSDAGYAGTYRNGAPETRSFARPTERRSNQSSQGTVDRGTRAGSSGITRSSGRIAGVEGRTVTRAPQIDQRQSNPVQRSRGVPQYRESAPSQYRAGRGPSEGGQARAAEPSRPTPRLGTAPSAPRSAVTAPPRTFGTIARQGSRYRAAPAAAPRGSANVPSGNRSTNANVRSAARAPAAPRSSTGPSHGARSRGDSGSEHGRGRTATR